MDNKAVRKFVYNFVHTAGCYGNAVKSFLLADDDVFNCFANDTNPYFVANGQASAADAT